MIEITFGIWGASVKGSHELDKELSCSQAKNN